jgi:hypothetical protein
LNTLGYPKAALFAFCVALACYNLLAATKGGLCGIHGEETMEKTLSIFYVTQEISSVYPGMMIALPPEKWVVFQTLSLKQLAETIRRWAGYIDMTKYQKSRRGPKKPAPSRPNAKFRHVSTKKLLDEAQLRLKPGKATASKTGRK